jgi:predicted dehydrogenase
MTRKIRMGMIGGGAGAFIGAIHRYASRGDGLIELVCGAFSSDPNVAIQSGADLGLPPERVYRSYTDMFVHEASLPEGERMDFVAIVTPNHVHFDPAMMALDHGFHVFLEKPMTLNLEEAKQLDKKVRETGLLFGLAHTYTGYPMVREARERVASGAIGTVRKIFVNYHQGWLSELSEKEGNKQASWRTDPAKSGQCGAMGDIGTHAFNLMEYISGLEVIELCAVLNIVVPGRALDDDGTVIFKMNNGATGTLTASQVAAGEENALILKIYGDKGGIEWHQMEPNTLLLKLSDGPMQVIRAGTPFIGAQAQFNSRTPSGHPEGYLEAFANLYKNFGTLVADRISNRNKSNPIVWLPGIKEGVRGMAFLDNVVKSHLSSEKWQTFEI